MEPGPTLDSPGGSLLPFSGAVRRWIWLAGSVALAGMIVAHWAPIKANERFVTPTTPLDRVRGANEDDVRGWRFLQQVREILPPDATYTVVADEPHPETSLYFLSLALLHESRGLPTHYGLLEIDAGADARYVLVDRCSQQPAGATLVRRFDEGCVWDRGPR